MTSRPNNSHPAPFPTAFRLTACLCLVFFSVGCDREPTPLLQTEVVDHEPVPLLRPEVVEREIGPIWPPIFFPSVHTKNLHVGIEDLEDKELQDDEYEIRIYEGFGLQVIQRGGHPLNLIVIRLHNDTVTTVHHPSHPDGRTERVHEETSFWNQLCQLGIFTMPDSSMIEGYRKGYRDGVCYVVELKRGDHYSHYMYSNPLYKDVPEAAEFIAILEHVREHTGF